MNLVFTLERFVHNETFESQKDKTKLETIKDFHFRLKENSLNTFFFEIKFR